MQLCDEDHILIEGAAWFNVKGFAIRIQTTDEGVIVDIYDDKALASSAVADDALLSSTYAFFDELGGNIDD